MSDAPQQPPIDIRQELFAEFVSHYQAISAQLQRLPLDVHLKSLALQQFYLGFLLAKEAFFTMNVDALQDSGQEGKPNTNDASNNG